MQRLRETSIELEVPFHDVDVMGVVWHGHYYKYLELARTALLRGCELDAGDLIGPVYGLFVIDSRCRHAHPLFYRDGVRVTAWVSDYSHRIKISYEVTNLTHQRRAARAHTVLATTDLQRNLLWETPDEIVHRLLA